ncbi:MAG: DUF58 domain-containing protein [Nanoarchaeota archaeon]
MERTLNLSIADRVAEFENLIKKVLPKNVFYQIVYGKGLEFDGYRDFQPDEDSTSIDWKATIRNSGKLLARKYIEERDLKIFFLIDVSDDMIFGSTEKLKCEYAAELVAALSHVILIAGDRVGFIFFNNDIVKIRDPAMGDKQFSILQQELSDPLNYEGVSDLGKVLEITMGRINKSTNLVFIVSDFLKINQKTKEILNSFSALFETIAIVVRDPLDISFPDLNKEIVIEDDYGDKLIINPHVAKNIYEQNSLEQTRFMRTVFRDAGIDFVEFTTDQHFAINLAEFLKERTKRRVYKKQDVH